MNRSLHDVVVLSAVRSPIGKVRGALAGVRPDDLLAQVLKGVLKQGVNIEPSEVDEVIAGCANQAGEDNRNVARMATLLAGFPYEVPAHTVNRLCASGLSAVVSAMRSLQVGDAELVVACGVESMSRAPFVLGKSEAAFEGGNRTAYDTALGWRFPNPAMAERFPLETMGETAENLVERFGISREAQDAFALRSHQRAAAAWESGAFEKEVMTIVPPGKGAVPCSRDEGPRADSTLAKLASLRAAFKTPGTVTAGNASTLNDGAAALVLATAEKAQKLGLKPMARLVASGRAGVDPRVMGIGPVPAIKKALAKAQWQMSDVDLVEVNEAFAVQVLAVQKELGIADDRLNVQGGAIALGHPLGCSGARLAVTMAHQLQRRGKGRGLVSLCVGVGQGEALLLEAV